MLPPTNYKVIGWGSGIGDGVSQAQYVQLSGVAKRNSTTEPNIVAAEMIAARLGQAILLPIPPAFIVEGEKGPWFASLDFNLAGESLPPVKPAEVVAQFPKISAGIIVFDAWIMNRDRHCWNLAHHAQTGRLQVFDHSRALMPSVGQRDFAERFRNDLAIGHHHCLARHIIDEFPLAEWVERIRQIPTYYLYEVLAEAVPMGLEPNNVTYFFNLLSERRSRLPQLLKNNRSYFPALQQLGLGGPQAWN